MDELARLFGSQLRVKTLRAFFMNENGPLSVALLAERTGGDKVQLRREVKLLCDIGFLKEKAATEKTKTGKKRSVKGYVYDPEFVYGNALRNLVVSAESLNPNEVLARLKGKGQLSVVIAAGVFIDEPKSRVDLIIVGDRLKRAALEEVIRDIETEVGKELTYGIFTTEEFYYRLDMYDKFMRDVLDFPHKMLLNKLNFSY